MSYKPLPYGTLVTVPRRNGLRLGLINDHELRPDRKPGIGRVVYRVQPCTVRDGKPDTWSRMFRPMDFPATKVRVVTPEEGARLLATGEARDWS